MAKGDLKKAGLHAAREARTLLAALMEDIGADDPALTVELTNIVGALFGAEVGDEDAIHDALLKAGEALERLLEQTKRATSPVGKIAGRSISQSLAMMHSAKEALARQLSGDERKEPTAPFLLSSGRVKANVPDDVDAERREDRRSLVEVDVGLSGDTRFFTGTTGDLSIGGLFVATGDPLSVGTEITLAFVLPDGYRVSSAATVTWVRAPRYRPDELPAGMGVRFDGLSDKDIGAIRHFLKQRPAFHFGG